MTIQALGDRVFVKDIGNEDKSKGGILLPDKLVDRISKGEVVSVGSGRYLPNGDHVPIELKVGDRVIYDKFVGVAIIVDGEPLLAVATLDLIGVEIATLKTSKKK